MSRSAESIYSFMTSVRLAFAVPTFFFLGGFEKLPNLATTFLTEMDLVKLVQ